MHFYPHHIGDYVAATRHLTPLEDIAYRRLLDRYYLDEQPPAGTLTEVARSVGMREHEVEVEAVLAEFFVPEEANKTLWRNARADREVAAYQQKKALASKAGKASAAARRNKR